MTTSVNTNTISTEWEEKIRKDAIQLWETDEMKDVLSYFGHKEDVGELWINHTKEWLSLMIQHYSKSSGDGEGADKILQKQLKRHYKKYLRCFFRENLELQLRKLEDELSNACGEENERQVQEKAEQLEQQENDESMVSDTSSLSGDDDDSHQQQPHHGQNQNQNTNIEAMDQSSSKLMSRSTSMASLAGLSSSAPFNIIAKGA